MNSDKFTSLELSILSFFIFSNSLSIIIVNLFNNTPTLNVILSIGIYFIIGLLFIRIYLKGFNFYNNLFLKSNVFIKCLFILFSLLYALFLIFNLSIIIKEIILPDMSIIAIGFFFLIVSSILSFKGIKSISIASNLFFLIYVMIIIISFCFNLENVDSINLLPMNLNSNFPFIKIFLLSFSPLFMLHIIPKKNIYDFDKYKKYLKYFYIIFCLYLLFKILFIISILGIKYFSFTDYPYINILKMINIFDFFQRMEEVLIINIFIECLITCSLSINYSSTVLNSIFNFKNKIFILIGIILFLIFINIDTLSNNLIYICCFIFILINLVNYFCIRKTK